MIITNDYNLPGTLNGNSSPEISTDNTLQHLLDSFSTVTSMNVAITDLSGKTIKRSKQDDTEFCRLIKKSPRGLERCFGSYERAGEEAKKWNEPYFFRCHAGLIAWACPILFNGRHEGNFICGQVLLWQPTKYQMKEFINNTKELGIDQNSLLQAVNKLEVISAEKVQSAADLLFVIASYFAQSGTSMINYQQKLRSISSWIWNECSHKKSDLNSDLLDKSYFDSSFIDLENEIFREIRQSNREHARDLLNKLALFFFVRSKGQIEVIKGLSIEFISFLARLATESGSKFEDSIRFSINKMRDLETADTVEKVFLWLLTTGNTYIDLLSEENVTSSHNVINKALAYIEENYASQDLSVQDIANACHISSGYLSRQFKSKKGHTLTDQISIVRIEKAQALLRNSDKTITEISRQVGFNDRSYFCKVFKKIVGLSPNQYRKRIS